MSQKEVTGIVEFHSFGDDGGVGYQIDQWLQQYPHVTVIDTKYQVVSYQEGNTIKFAAFALVLFHETNVPEVNRATTQKMQLPPRMTGTGRRS